MRWAVLEHTTSATTLMGEIGVTFEQCESLPDKDLLTVIKSIESGGLSPEAKEIIEGVQEKPSSGLKFN